MIATAVAIAAAAIPCGPADAKTVVKTPAARVYKRADLPGKPYVGCWGTRKPRRLWRSAFKPTEEISFDLPRFSGGRVAFVDYYCTTAGFHHAHIRVVDLRTGRRRSWRAHTTDPVPFVKARVPTLTLDRAGNVTWTAEHTGALERRAERF